MATCKVFVRDESVNNDLLPKLVEFTNGSLKADALGLAAKFDLYRPINENPTSVITETRLMVATCDGNRYHGGPKKAPNGCKYYIGIVDEDKGEMEIVKTNIFKLRPAALDKSALELERAVEESNAKKTTLLEKNDHLVVAFGSARQKRAVSSRQKFNVDKEAMGERVAEAVAGLDTSVVEKSPNNIPTDCSTILPLCNPTATIPSEIYPIDGIISRKELSFMQSLYHSYAEDERHTLFSKNSFFVEDRLANLPLEESSKLESFCRLLYLDYLIHFNSVKFSDIRGKDPLPDFPDEMRDSFFLNYTAGNGNARTIPKRYRDKVLCHTLILSLIIDGFTLDCRLLHKDLKISSAKLSNQLKAIGCTVKVPYHSKKRKSTGGEEEQAPEMAITATLSAPLSRNFRLI